ncbi:hypothetical protein [Halomicrococcus gelatinilyticus]|uniref:hypothetical protein n=1 Tax=Halomicrococcus gelatinilyticus TaxID=1702103 RepID=UPI002E1683FC
MVSSRTVTAAVGVLGSLLLWQYFDTLAFFLFVPFVPFLFRGNERAEPARQCLVCGFRTRNDEYCPRDERRLE